MGTICQKFHDRVIDILAYGEMDWRLSGHVLSCLFVMVALRYHEETDRRGKFKMTGLMKKLVAACFIVCFAQQVFAEGAHMVTFTKQSTFAEVKEAVEMAITGRGFVINNISHVGNMLERTGKDLGGGKQVFLQAEALEFCSATVSRKMMEADPDNIVFCPYIISIYVLPNKSNEVRVAYRKTQMVGTIQSQNSLKEVNVLLKEIIEEALQ